MMETSQAAVGVLTKAKSDPNIWQICAKRVRNGSLRRSNSRKEKGTTGYEDGKRRSTISKHEANGRRNKPNNLMKEDGVEKYGDAIITPVIQVQKKRSLTDPRDNMADGKFVGESEEDAAMRREAFQCLRSTRRRGPDFREDIPDQNMRIDLHALYLEAKGHKISDSQSRNLEGRKLWGVLRSKFSGKKVNILESLRELLEEIGECGKDLVKNDLAKYKNMHWTDLASEKIDQATLDALPSKDRKRYEALWELFHAEVRYITDHLLVLKEVFYMPMVIVKKLGFLERVDPAIVFGNLDAMIETCTSFAEGLLKMFDVESYSDFGNSKAIVHAFKKFNLTMNPEYQEYCVNYSRSRGHLNSLSTNVQFKEFVKWSEADVRCNRRQLNDLLVAPVQHLTKYPLLLKAIKSYTTKHSSEYDSLMTVLASVQRSINEIESELHVISNIDKIREISENLIWPSLIGTDSKTFIPEFLRAEILSQRCHTFFENPWRVLLLEGYLTCIEHTKTELYVLLFDDMILLTKHKRGGAHGKLLKRRNTNNQLSESSTNQEDLLVRSPLMKRSSSPAGEMPSLAYVVAKQPIPLDRVKIHDCEEYLNSGSAYKYAFVLEEYNRFCQTVAVYTLQALTSQEKNTWVQQLRNAQKNYVEVRYFNDEDFNGQESDSVLKEKNNNSMSFLPGTFSNHCETKRSTLSSSKRVMSSPSLQSAVERFKQSRLKLFSIPY